MLALHNAYRTVFFLFLLTCAPLCLYGYSGLQPFGCVDMSSKVLEKGILNKNILRKAAKNKKHKKLYYYLYIRDFANSFIEIPTANVSVDSSTIASRYLAGRAPIYNKHDKKVGTCSASFLCMQNNDGIFTDISNYLSVNNGLIISWLTPTKLINLELDSIIHSMVTKCRVVASTKIGFNPYYGETFNMVVSADSERIFFKLTEYKKN